MSTTPPIVFRLRIDLLDKTCQLIIDTENHYLGALKGNQGNLLRTVQANSVPEVSYAE